MTNDCCAAFRLTIFDCNSVTSFAINEIAKQRSALEVYRTQTTEVNNRKNWIDWLTKFRESYEEVDKLSEEDKKYAEVWNNYYDPQEAFDFGENIKKIIDEKDLAGLFEHVDGELTSGPSKNFIAGKNFSEIFSDEWRKSLLESESPCSPVGWRGFMLDSGSVWYNRDKEKDKWHIFGILEAKKEDLNHKNIPVTWDYEGKVIPPHSLSTHVKGNCTKAYLVSIGDYSGGTMGWDMSYNIYGLFSLSDEQKYILPLKNFYKKNDAINFIK